jgi:hypothetical protein
MKFDNTRLSYPILAFNTNILNKLKLSEMTNWQTNFYINNSIKSYIQFYNNVN